MKSQWMLILDCNIIDGGGVTSGYRSSILLHNNNIHSIGLAEKLRGLIPRGEDSATIDAAGRTVMPGLIDAHCHMTYGESNAEEEIDLYTSVESRTLIAAKNCQKVLRAGVTSISEPGGSFFIGCALRDAIRGGMFEGPRIVSASRYLTTSNGLTDYYPTTVGVPMGSIGVLTNSLPEMLSEIRRQVKCGVDLIKLADSPGGAYQAFTDNEMKEIADLTHQLGKKVTIHARGSAETGAASRAGLDWIQHGNYMTDDVIEQVAENGTPIVPTLAFPANLADFGHLVGTRQKEIDRRKLMMEKTAVVLHKAKEAGITLLSGTDSGFAVIPYGEWHAREMELMMIYAGMNSLEAIASMTSWAAPTVNLEGRVGMVADGYLADLLIVNGDPERNIRVLQDKKNIDIVIKDGRVVSFDGYDPDVRFSQADQVMYFSQMDLTWDKVYGSGVDRLAIIAPWGNMGRDLFDELDPVGRARSTYTSNAELGMDV